MESQSRISPRQAVESGVHGLERATERAEQGLDQAMTRVGSGFVSAGEGLESAGRNAGRSIRSAGEYMKRAHPATVRDDIADVMRNHPGTTLLVGVGTGLLLGRLLLGGRRHPSPLP